jgi:hypothetical protein
VAIALALWRAPRTPAGFAAASALVFLVFFAFNKQAFTNYYSLVIGALCTAAAAARLPDVEWLRRRAGAAARSTTQRAYGLKPAP